MTVVARRMLTTTMMMMMIRDFECGDGPAIHRFLSSSSSSSSSSSPFTDPSSSSSSSSSSSFFDTEGPLSVDCATVATIQECYYDSQDGCFLVATTIPTPQNTTTTTTTTSRSSSDDQNEIIIGTGGLVVGTITSYPTSSTEGTSWSTPTIRTGAIRRVCGSTQGTCQQLVKALEIKAVEHNADEIIVLAYPPVLPHHRQQQQQQEATKSIVVQRPTTHLLEAIGYQRSVSQLRGTDVIQYVKQLKTTTNDAKDTQIINGMPSDGFVEALAAGIVVIILLITTTLIAQLMGIDTFSNANQQLGTPLSTEELNRMQQDERLQRTELDDGMGVGRERQWQDLSSEEQWEEIALLKVIQGQDIRIK